MEGGEQGSSVQRAAEVMRALKSRRGGGSGIEVCFCVCGFKCELSGLSDF